MSTDFPQKVTGWFVSITRSAVVVPSRKPLPEASAAEALKVSLPAPLLLGLWPSSRAAPPARVSLPATTCSVRRQRAWRLPPSRTVLSAQIAGTLSLSV